VLLPAALTVALLAAACGKKGDPRPPLPLVPAQTEDLRVFQQGSSLVLQLTHPRVTAAGRTLPPLTAVELWQSVVALPDPDSPPTVDPARFRATARRLLVLAGPELEGATVGDQMAARVLTLERFPEPIELWLFAVRTVPAGGEPSELSNLARVIPRPPPPPPGGLRLTPSQEGIEVAWEPPAGPEDLVGFRVYRRDARSRIYTDPLHTVGPHERRHLDQTARFGERYIYTVTSVASHQPRRESAYAVEREIEYQDRFPPPPPAELVALPQAGGVRLVWRPSAAPDVAGYHVYRRDPGAEPRRLTLEPIADLRFVDEGLASGLVFRYQVSAVDHAGNEGEATDEVEARVP
jgi:hypothetical protein